MLSPTAHHEPVPGTTQEPAQPIADDRPENGIAPRGQARLGKGLGWYVTFLVLALWLFVGIGYFTDVDAIAGSVRFLWNALAVLANSVVRALGGLLALLAKGVGWRRLSRIATAILGVGLSYSGGVLLSEGSLRRAQGWSGRLRFLLATVHRRWLGLHIAWKLAIVAALIASQVYLHFLLVLFPIAFLVPVVRRLWVQTADMLVGRWYWKTFGQAHRAIVAFLRRMFGVRHLIGWARLTRIRYLRAWRLWRYDPRYRCPETGRHEVSLIEPIRLWLRGELDGYVGRHLLGGRSRTTSLAPEARAHQPGNLVE